VSDTSLLFTIFAVDKASSVVNKTGGAMSKLAMGIGVAAAGIAAKSTQMAANFQTNMLKLQTSAGESAGNMKLVSNGVLDLATKTGDSTTALSEALYTVESGGQHGAAGLLVLKAAAQGAKAEGADLNTVADATTSILQDYHLKATDAALVTSKLVATTGAGKTTFEQLAGSLHSVLPVASAAHISLNDILGAEASMTVHGMSADQVTQNLADTIRHMQNPTQVQAKELGQLGINASSLSGMLGTKGLTGTLQYVSETILSKMGPSGKVLLGTMMQSKQAAADAKTMYDAMDPSMQKLATQFMNGKVSAAQFRFEIGSLTPIQQNQISQWATLEKRSTGFSDALKSGTPAAQSYSAALAKAMGDSTGLSTALMLTGDNTKYTNSAVATIAKTTAAAGGNVKGWAEIQSTFNVRMAQAREQVEVLSIRIGTALLPYMTRLVSAVGASVSWLTKHKTVAQAAAVTVGALAAAVLVYKGYVMASAAWDKVQVGYMAAKRAVMATITGVQWAWNAAQAASNGTIATWIAVQAIDFAGWVRKTVVVAADTVAMYAQLAAIEAVSIATKLWAAAQWLINVAMDANPVGLIIAGIALLVVGVLYLWNHCKPFRDFMIAMWRDIWGWLKSVGAWFAGPFARFWVETYDKIKNGIVDVVLWIHAKVTEVKATLSHIWDTLKDGVVTAVFWVHDHIESMIAKVKAIPGRLAAAGRGMWNFVYTEFRAAVDSVIRGWNNLHFSLPSFDVLGFHTPGFTLNTPNIPYLQHGGTAMTPGYAVVGDRGPELAYMPPGASIQPLRGGRTQNGAGPGGQTIICLHMNATTQAIVKDISAYVRGNYGGDVQLALQGH